MGGDLFCVYRSLGKSGNMNWCLGARANSSEELGCSPQVTWNTPVHWLLEICNLSNIKRHKEWYTHDESCMQWWSDSSSGFGTVMCWQVGPGAPGAAQAVLSVNCAWHPGWELKWDTTWGSLERVGWRGSWEHARVGLAVLLSMWIPVWMEANEAGGIGM